jgi:hypothetical protein
MHFVSSSKEQKKYQLIAQELGIKYYLLESYYDISCLAHKQGYIYSITVEEIENISLSQKLLDSPLEIEK